MDSVLEFVTCVNERLKVPDNTYTKNSWVEKGMRLYRLVAANSLGEGHAYTCMYSNYKYSEKKKQNIHEDE